MTNFTYHRQLISKSLLESNLLTKKERNILQSPYYWWLLGTQGCHLCTNAEETLKLFSKVYPIQVFTIDIANLDGSLMTLFSTRIPILLTPVEELHGNFSVADLQKLV